MNSRRGLFQIHLMTAIVLMFAAGGLMFLNSDPGRQVWFVSDYKLQGAIADPVISKSNLWGWPFECAQVERDADKMRLMFGQTDVTKPRSLLIFPVQRLQIEWPRVLMNIAVGLVILIIMAVGIEWLLRRKRRPA